MSRQRRWCFTYNNYPGGLDLQQLFDGATDRVFRYVVGKEVSQSSTPHLQGYVEFRNPLSFVGVRKLLPSAHWEVAKGDAASNYKYCTKDGSFFTFGDWSSKVGSVDAARSSCDSTTTVLRLLHADPRDGIRNGKLYLSKKRAFDERLAEIRFDAALRARYDGLRTALLSGWQMSTLRQLFNQSDRSILWVYDIEGGCGKSFLAHFLCAMYEFDLFDGVTAARDVVFMLQPVIRGIVFDVTRTDSRQFSYNTLEACKNGFVMTGKYQGLRRVFKPVPVVVFANIAPDVEQLTRDRWEIRDLKDVKKTSKVPAYDPSKIWPYRPPPPNTLEEDQENIPPE